MSSVVGVYSFEEMNDILKNRLNRQACTGSQAGITNSEEKNEDDVGVDSCADGGNEVVEDISEGMGESAVEDEDVVYDEECGLEEDTGSEKEEYIEEDDNQEDIDNEVEEEYTDIGCEEQDDIEEDEYIDIEEDRIDDCEEIEEVDSEIEELDDEIEEVDDEIEEADDEIEEVDDEIEEQIDYSKMTIEELWKEVREFMIENGVREGLVDKELVEDKFGVNNILKLVRKAYMIPRRQGYTMSA